MKTSNKRKKKNIDPNRTIGKIKDMKTIHERDIIFPEVKNNTNFGYFEGDTIIRANHASAVLTLTERKTKCLMTIKFSENKSAEQVKNKLVECFRYIQLLEQ